MLLDHRQIQHHCPKHGTVTVNQVKLRKSDWGPPRCEACRQEAEAEEQRRREEMEAEAQRAEQRHRVREAFGRAGIPERFKGRTFDAYRAECGKSLAALNLCREYAADFPNRKTRGQSIVMCGNTGTGKTHLACAIAHTVIEQGAEAVYATASRAFRSVKDTYRRDAELSETEAIKRFTYPDLLILDEIGVQYGSDSEKNILFDIINERYERLLPTILISNLSLENLAGYVGDRVLDRMKENGGKLLVCDWKSHRGAV
jgi:DNA replication protein DnaC